MIGITSDNLGITVSDSSNSMSGSTVEQNRAWADDFNLDNQGSGYSVQLDESTNQFIFTLPNGTQTDPMSREDAEIFAENPDLMFGMMQVNTSDPESVNAWIALFENENPGHTASYDYGSDTWNFGLDDTKPEYPSILKSLDFLEEMMALSIRIAC